jgi:hypothetical protein
MMSLLLSAVQWSGAQSTAPVSSLVLSPMTLKADRHLLSCTSPSSYPTDLDLGGVLTPYGMSAGQGGGMLAFLLIGYLLMGWAILFSDYLVPLSNFLSIRLKWDPRKGDSVMAASFGSFIFLALSMWSVFHANSAQDIGTATAVGAVYANNFVGPALIYFSLPTAGFFVYWWRALRHLLIQVCAALLLLIVIITGDQVGPVETGLLLALFVVLQLTLYFDSRLHQWMCAALHTMRIEQAKSARRPTPSALHRLLHSFAFFVTINVLILLSLTLAIWGLVSTQPWIDQVNVSISALFLLEMLLKHLAFGTFGYWRSVKTRMRERRQLLCGPHIVARVNCLSFLL